MTNKAMIYLFPGGRKTDVKSFYRPAIKDTPNNHIIQISPLGIWIKLGVWTSVMIQTIDYEPQKYFEICEANTIVGIGVIINDQ